MTPANRRPDGLRDFRCTAPFDSAQVVVSVEHASCAVPKVLDGLGLPARHLASHNGWDPGAKEVGRMLARRFSAPLHLGRWSRLVADLNRSSNHRRVVPETTAGRWIPANRGLSREQRQQRLTRYWQPFRQAVEADLDRVIAATGRVLHISVHSFVERLAGEERRNHFGLLYKPSHAAEMELANLLDAGLSACGYRVRRNYPYSGLDDGFCMRMRAERDWATYLGMEIEMNQRWLRPIGGARRLGADLVAAFANVIAD